MVTDEQRAHIRRLYFAEHWKVGTIAAEEGDSYRRREAEASLDSRRSRRAG